MKKATSKNILESVEHNHIWLNAFACISPTKEFCEKVGREVLSMLNQKENRLMSTNNINEELYLRINKS